MLKRKILKKIRFIEGSGNLDDFDMVYINALGWASEKDRKTIQKELEKEQALYKKVYLGADVNFGIKVKKRIEAYKWVLKQKPKIPTGMTLQKSLTKSGGQMHFKNGGGKKKPKTLSAKKTKKRVKRIKKGSDNLMSFGIRMPNVKTLEDLMR